jgi:hypothetical protein
VPESILKPFFCKSNSGIGKINDFVEKAVEFYVGHLNNEESFSDWDKQC